MTGEKAKGKRPSISEQAEQQATFRRRNRGGGSVEPADWSSVNPALLAGVIHAITKRGFAVQFGYTRDFGAYVVRIVGDGEPFNEYIRPTEDVELHLTGLFEDYS